MYSSTRGFPGRFRGFLPDTSIQNTCACCHIRLSFAGRRVTIWLWCFLRCRQAIISIVFLVVSCACRQHCRHCILLFFEPSPLVPVSAVRVHLWLQRVFLKLGVRLGLGFRTLSTRGFPKHLLSRGVRPLCLSSYVRSR